MKYFRELFADARRRTVEYIRTNPEGPPEGPPEYEFTGQGKVVVDCPDGEIEELDLQSTDASRCTECGEWLVGSGGRMDEAGETVEKWAICGNGHVNELNQQNTDGDE